MTHKAPPVPPENQSPHGGRNRAGHDETPRGKSADEKSDKMGQQANTEQNTRNQGFQQDR